MAKTNSSFNLTKTTKRIMSTIVNAERRASFKKLMIDAEHSYIVNKNRRPRDNSSGTREATGE